MNINKLLSPERIAIVGASEKEGFGGDTCRNVLTYMDEGSYYFINPKRDTIFDKKCYNSIEELPENIDLVVICTPQKTVEDIIKQATTKGAKAAVVYASGYSEVGTKEGIEAEQSLIKLCEELDVALMGPNCAGYVNFIKNTSPFAFISDKRERKGSVGVVSQSGQLVLSMMDSPKMKFSYAISAGNSSVCKMENYLEYLIDDEDTKVIAMYIEGVKDAELFIKALKKAALKRKPIVALKTGRSQKAQEIAASHTGSLSGADKVFDALFKKFGVIRVDDLEELMSTSLALATIKKMPTSEKVAAMNLSGGETGICADLGELHGINFADFTPDTLDKLTELLPSYATPNNPLDMTATLSYDSEKYAEALSTVMSDPSVGIVAVGYTLLQEIADPAIIYMAKGIEMVTEREDSKPVVMIPFTENTRNLEYSEKLEKIGVPVLPTSNYAFKILKNISDFVAYDVTKHNLDVKMPMAKDENEVALSESESRAKLEKYGIPFPGSIVAKTEAEAIAAAKKIDYPLVAKIDSPDILHKSDIGCVKLNLNDENQVIEAFKEIINNAKQHYPNAQIDGVQITTMVKSGAEMIIGVNNDPNFGPCLLCGLGGVFVEVFKDTALCLAPVSKDEAYEMVNSLQGIKLLQGYRGSKPADIDAYVEAIINVSNFACDNINNLKELDINPIFVYEDNVCAVDALIVEK
ncbi:acetyltransferase [Desulfonispora thiosulfatigenes DSM 11270]|uniref:Acetyltransferase n=1 Tax=Desulfonispora thiosulfatigenes DSM 11270 TaxID=656914 RepID=A0A1W1VP95_DESTI|nr:acetate--CoA ligase family protein [Desulfonispora thiosulfatigenes]SMB95146.1 acetyltransferase [Desulfonispora thiosulfatigenes DSM 11270]